MEQEEVRACPAGGDGRVKLHVVKQDAIDDRLRSNDGLSPSQTANQYRQITAALIYTVSSFQNALFSHVAGNQFTSPQDWMNSTIEASA